MSRPPRPTKIVEFSTPTFREHEWPMFTRPDAKCHHVDPVTGQWIATHAQDTQAMEFPTDPADLPKFIDDQLNELRRTSSLFAYYELTLIQRYMPTLTEAQRMKLMAIIGWTQVKTLIDAKAARAFLDVPPALVHTPE